MKHSKLIHFSLIIVLSGLFSIQCNDKNQFEFPVVYMDASINIYTDAEFLSLRGAGNAMEITSHPNGDNTLGYDNNGILIYNSGIDQEMYYVFDRTCPFDLPNSVAVELNGNTAICPTCGSVYVLPSEGQPSIGSKSPYFLKKYHSYFNPNTGLLQITN